MDKDLSDAGVADEKAPGAPEVVPQLAHGQAQSSTLGVGDELEKGAPAAGAYGKTIGGDEGVKQGLESRHLQLMSLAGAVGECGIMASWKRRRSALVGCAATAQSSCL